VRAELRSREAELAVLRLEAERRQSELSAAEPARPEPQHEHLLFIPRHDGYELVTREGPPPERGEIVDGDFVVVRTGRSPLPHEKRVCVYLADR
jgi:hypothetical protein